MPRITRGLADGGIYHVLNRGNGRQEIFHKDGDFAAFIELLRLARERHPITMFGYCLVPNHFHLLLEAEKIRIKSFHAVADDQPCAALPQALSK